MKSFWMTMLTAWILTASFIVFQATWKNNTLVKSHACCPGSGCASCHVAN